MQLLGELSVCKKATSSLGFTIIICYFNNIKQNLDFFFIYGNTEFGKTKQKYVTI